MLPFYFFLIFYFLCCAFPINTMQQAQVQGQVAQPAQQLPIQHAVSQDFFNQNYTAPLYIQSKVNQEIDINTVGFTPALVKKRTWHVFEKPIESIDCSDDGNMAIVWDREQVSVGNRNSNDLRKALIGANKFYRARGSAFWHPDGSLAIADYNNTVYHWPKEAIQELAESEQNSSTIDRVTCSARSTTRSFIGLENGTVCVFAYAYIHLYDSKQACPVQAIAPIDDNHIAVIYKNDHVVQLFDLSQFDVEHAICNLEANQKKVKKIKIPFDGVSCSTIAAINPKILVLGSKDGMIRVIEQQDQNQWIVKSEGRGATSPIKKIIPCGDCILVIGKKDPACYLRHLTGTLIYKINAPEGCYVIDVAIFPDGTIAIAYSNNTIELFEIQIPALQSLQEFSQAQLHSLGLLMQTCTKHELEGIPLDKEHFGDDNLASLQKLPAPVRDNLLRNYNNFLHMTNGDNPAPVQVVNHQLPQQPQIIAQAGNNEPLPVPRLERNLMNSLRHMHPNKLVIGFLIATAFVLITGKPSKLARKIRPFFMFPFTIYKHFWCTPNPSFSEPILLTIDKLPSQE